MNKNYNAFETAQAQFDNVAEILELDQSSRDLLRNPLRVSDLHASLYLSQKPLRKLLSNKRDTFD